MTTQTASTPRTFEERLQPWLEQGGTIIPLIVVLIAWVGGWVNLVTFESFDADVLGRYSWPFFALLVLYTLGFALWATLIVNLRALEALKAAMVFVQQQPLLFVAAWALFLGVAWSMLTIPLWRSFPLVQAALLITMLVFTGLVLLSDPAGQGMQGWRIVALALIGLLIVSEALLQGLAFVGVLPFDATSGLGVPYGRIYADGVYEQANEYGWNYPAFAESDEVTNYILLGDVPVQGLGVAHEDHMGQLLETRLNETAGQNVQVLAQGMPGLGAQNYLHTLYWPYLWEPLNPVAIIVLVDLARDFDTSLDFATPLLRASRSDAGIPYLYRDEATFEAWHDEAHGVIGGYDPPNPLQIALHQSLLWQGAEALLSNDELNARPDVAWASLSEDSLDVARIYEEFGQYLAVFTSYLRSQQVEVLLVTIPPLDATQEPGDLVPEARVQDIAQSLGIPTLALGTHWRTALEEATRATYYRAGQGGASLTEAGHFAAADAMYDCFVAQDAFVGCSR